MGKPWSTSGPMEKTHWDISCFAAAQRVRSSGCRLLLTSQLVLLKTSVPKMIQPRGKFLNCVELINQWLHITWSKKAEKHYELGDLTKLKPFASLHRDVNKALIDITGGFPRRGNSKLHE